MVVLGVLIRFLSALPGGDVRSVAGGGAQQRAQGVGFKFEVDIGYQEKIALESVDIAVMSAAETDVFAGVDFEARKALPMFFGQRAQQRHAAIARSIVAPEQGNFLARVVLRQQAAEKGFQPSLGIVSDDRNIQLGLGGGGGYGHMVGSSEKVSMALISSLAAVDEYQANRPSVRQNSVSCSKGATTDGAGCGDCRAWRHG